ncbi:MAG: hypothetical protein HYW48_07110 [Deltaproteobacteria bacterium]|nr:hypothetical protein [Deltaproteobacteria bacterium]
MEEPAAQFPPNHLLAPSGLRITGTLEKSLTAPQRKAILPSSATIFLGNHPCLTLFLPIWRCSTIFFGAISVLL